LLSSPISAPFMAEFDSLRAVLVSSSRSDDAVLDRLTAQLEDVDATHDRLVRLALGALRLAPLLADAALAALGAELTAILLPDGLETIRKSYRDEAGLADPRAAALTPDVRGKLARFPIPSSGSARSLVDVFDELQAAARQLGALISQRDAASRGTGPSAGELLDAKRKLIALVDHVLHTFHLLDARLDGTGHVNVNAARDSWDRAVHAATAAANARRSGASEATSSPTGSAGGTSPST
jgi:hypothetical protein